MSTSDSDEIPVRRADRVLAYMSLGVAVLSIVCFFTIMIATAAGMTQADFGHGLWPIIGFLPMIGLPLSFVLLITLVITSYVRRSRGQRRR